jgi:hypothetical protein
MYQRGDEVIVEGYGGRRAVLTVWEDRGRGVTLSSAEGYARLVAGDLDAPLVGFPRQDVKGRVSPSEQPQPSEQSRLAAQD